MALYVERPPAPAAGADWRYTVPGIYLERITGITATLDTLASFPTVAVDASGNGNDGSYQTINGDPFVPGLVVGDLACDFSTNAFGPNTVDHVQTPAALIDFTTDFSIVCLWENPTVAPTSFDVYATQQPPGFNTGLLFNVSDGVLGAMRLDNAGFNFWQTVAGPIPYDGLPHLLAVTRTGATIKFYVDGVLIVNAFNVGAPNPGPQDDAGINGFGGFGTNATLTVDEFGVWRRVLTAGEIAGLQAARGSFAAYSAAVFALTPDAYYHLDDVPVSTGRTPGLFVSDGTDAVLLIPDGFPAQTTPGPYRYSWSPTLRASNRDPTGTITSVAVPQLILPGGYVVGTRTPDIAPADQWSDVAIWWNDDAQRRASLGPYVFPGPAHLVYLQEGALIP
jgi:hypothetical protein